MTAQQVKSLPANAGDTGDAGSIPGLGRSPSIGNSNPLQYSCLENPTDRGAWWATVHGLAEGLGAGGVHTAKASRGESLFRGKGSAPGCIPKLVLPRPD